MRGLTAAAFDVLDRRLSRASSRPLAVAFSGGGDSLALLLIADAWARRAGRELLVLTVDHGLQAPSAAWTEQCRATAARLGRPFRPLVWEGAKPANGLPSAARGARHRLLSEAAREAGAKVTLVGHTADDVAEARAMRRTGSTTPEPREWSPAPVWPEGRGLFLLRPLLAARRTALRAWLAERGESWIDDPANLDRRYARSRARAKGAAVTVELSETPPLALAASVLEANGALLLDRSTLRLAAADEARRLLALACVCAGGGERPPRAARLDRLAQAVRGDQALVATLTGARVEADDRAVRIAREAGELRRGGLAPASLPLGREVVWDGRFALAARRAGLEVRALAGLASKLPKSERRRLAGLPPAVRGALPAIVTQTGEVSCPLLAEARDVEVRSLVGERLRASSGLVEREDP